MIRAEQQRGWRALAGSMKYQASAIDREDGVTAAPSSASLFQRWPAQPKNRLPITLKPPIMPSVCALSIGSRPQIRR